MIFSTRIKVFGETNSCKPLQSTLPQGNYHERVPYLVNYVTVNKIVSSLEVPMLFCNIELKIYVPDGLGGLYILDMGCKL